MTLGANLLRQREAILRIANFLRMNLTDRNRKRQKGHQTYHPSHQQVLPIQTGISNIRTESAKLLFTEMALTQKPYLSLLT